MKDYTFSLDEKGQFVLNYDKDDQNIIIHFADGTNYMIPNTKKNEAVVLHKMKNQIIESEEMVKTLDKKINEKDFFTGLTFLGGSILTISLMLITKNGSLLSAFIPFVSGAIISTCLISSNKKNRKLLDDLEKNMFFLENEQKISEALSNNNVLKNANNEVKHLAEEKELTVNTIDSYSYDSLVSVVSLNDIQNNFNFESYPEVEKPKRKRRKR